MKVVILTDGNKTSGRFRKAENLTTLITAINQRSDEKITAQNGKELVERINQIGPEALLIPHAGQAIRHLKENIKTYQIKPSIEINKAIELLDSYMKCEYKLEPDEKGEYEFKPYENLHPYHECGCATSESECSDCKDCKSCNH